MQQTVRLQASTSYALPSSRTCRALCSKQCLANSQSHPSLWRHGRPHKSSRRNVALSAKLFEKEGGQGVLEKPGLVIEIVPGSDDPKLDENFSGSDLDKAKKLGGGAYRVLLMDHPAHTEEQVVKAITATVPHIEEEYARNCYRTSKELGMAMVTSCIKEHAEFYCQQLVRARVRAKIEPDTTTL